MAYNPNIDYQEVINTAVAKGDYKAAAAAEAARNEKINAINAAGTNPQGYAATNLYAGNLDTVDRGTILRQALDSGASAEEVSQFLNDRTNKANSAVNLNQYANDALAQEAAAYIKQQNQAPSTVQGVQQLKPELSGIALGDKYGLTYDMGQIKGILDKATQGIYDNKNEAFKTTENNFYNQMGGLQAESIDALKKTQAAAVATGASKGMAAANELSAILGLQEQTAPLANDLANQKNLLASEEAAAYSKNASTALDTSNAIKQAIANLDLTKYGYDTQESIGIMDYLAALQDIAANKYASDKTLEGVKYNADSNLAGTKYSSSSGGSSGYGSGTTGAGSSVSPIGTSSSTTVADLDKLIADNNGTVTIGSTTYVKNADGTHTVTDASGTAPNITDAEVEKIMNNNNEVAAVGPNYGAFTSNSSSSDTNTKNMSERDVLNYYRKFGKAPVGWKVSADGTTASYTSQDKDPAQNQVITGAQGQKVSVGYNGTNTVWTYNANTGMWKSNHGDTTSMSSFKKYCTQQNIEYVKVLS